VNNGLFRLTLITNKYVVYILLSLNITYIVHARRGLEQTTAVSTMYQVASFGA